MLIAFLVFIRSGSSATASSAPTTSATRDTSTPSLFPPMDRSALPAARTASQCSGISTSPSTSTPSRPVMSSTLSSSHPTGTGSALPQPRASRSSTSNPSRLSMSSSQTLLPSHQKPANQSACPSLGPLTARPSSLVTPITSSGSTRLYNSRTSFSTLVRSGIYIQTYKHLQDTTACTRSKAALLSQIGYDHSRYSGLKE
jgi:hypothetical protein